jgi:hypothetical protein
LLILGLTFTSLLSSCNVNRLPKPCIGFELDLQLVQECGSVAHQTPNCQILFYM